MTTGYEYDAAGNLTRSQTSAGTWQRYEYDAAGRLVNVKTDNNVLILSYTYGSSNQRLSSVEGSLRTYYAWDGEATIAEYTESTITPGTLEWSKSYVYLGARLIATLQPNGNGGEFTQFHHPDRLGTRIMTNASDTNVQKQVSLPFGTALDAESTGANTRRFTSYDRSSSTGLDYAVNRHYDSQQGRFTQVDPYSGSMTMADPQSFNCYAYVQNDPVNFVDPTGLNMSVLVIYGWRCHEVADGPQQCGYEIVGVIYLGSPSAGDDGRGVDGGGGGGLPPNPERQGDYFDCRALALGKLASELGAKADDYPTGGDKFQDAFINEVVGGATGGAAGATAGVGLSLYSSSQQEARLERGPVNRFYEAAAKCDKLRQKQSRNKGNSMRAAPANNIIVVTRQHGTFSLFPYRVFHGTTSFGEPVYEWRGPNPYEAQTVIVGRP